MLQIYKLPQVGSVQLPSYNTTRRTYICYVYSDLCNMYIGVDIDHTEIIIYAFKRFGRLRVCFSHLPVVQFLNSIIFNIGAS